MCGLARNALNPHWIGPLRRHQVDRVLNLPVLCPWGFLVVIVPLRFKNPPTSHAFLRSGT